MPKIKCVIFDLDGVLVDAKEWHFDALNRALKIFGYAINRYEHLTTYDGLPTKAKLAILTHDQALPAALHPFISELKQHFTLDLIQSRCKPVFQHEYTLSRLKALGYRVGLASNSVRHSVELILTRSNLMTYFDHILTNEDVKKAKPEPEIYLKSCQSFGLQPAECLVVEDNDHGVQAARAAGCAVMVVGSVKDVNLENIQRHIQQLETPAA